MPLPRQARRRRNRARGSRVVGYAARNVTTGVSYPVQTQPSSSRSAVRRRNRRRANRAVNQIPVSPVMGSTVHRCTWDYVATILDPKTGPIGCVPDNYALPSSAFRVISKNEIAVGSGGYGQILLVPQVAVANDVNALFISGTGWAGSSWASSGTGITAVPFLTGMFADADFGGAGKSQYRIISAEIRVSFVGKLVDTNGYVTRVETIDHTSLGGVGYTTTQLLPGVEVLPTSHGTWYSVRWSGPKHPSERDYSSTAPSAAGWTGTMGIAVTGNSGDKFLTETYVCYEVVGTKNYTPRPIHQDAAGLNHVNSTLNEMGPQVLQNAKDTTIWQKLTNGINALAKSELLQSFAASAPALGSAATLLVNNYARNQARRLMVR